MASFRKRSTKTGDDRWFVEVRRRGFPPQRATFGRLTDAKAWAREVEHQMETGRYFGRVEAARHTLRQAVDSYLAGRAAELGRSTRGHRHGELAWWLETFRDVSLAEVTPTAIADRLRTLRETVSGPTCNRYLAGLSAVLEAARERGWVETNTARGVRRYPEHRGRVRFLSDDELGKLLEAAEASHDRRMLPLVLFAVVTGARAGELMGLRWRDVDLAADPPTALLEETKNSDRRRLAFPGQAGELLRRMARTPHINGYLFIGPQGSLAFPEYAWRKALRAAGIEDFRFHDLRHTAASYAGQAGASLLELASFLGHRSLAMVKRYAHLTEGHSEALSRKVERRTRRH